MLVRQLILASGSPYRLQRLKEAGLDPLVHAANIDESPQKHEDALTLSARLSKEKAYAVSAHYQNGFIIGSDQVAEVLLDSHSERLGKPGSKLKAQEQLALCSGRTVKFHTSLTVVDAESKRDVTQTETVTVIFNTLTPSQIATYINADNPIQCAGSFMMERAGIFLFKKILSEDPNALIGIPMIALRECLTLLEVDIFDLLKRSK
ncbi:septum formation protein Maf [Alteromonas sediminis]|uniref:7-methyl-GTP pyrophosphatase n=1 Tax=Alteromonas sediminis TaxID=2259342 RepID=A0A3N5Y0R3_9ALTE|nr:Maf family protein [Alteromonas sediminis]RPJ67297.1 septum formation protein Maf [Alteromonas sediminis]